jgi:hypothetical protein
MMDVSRGLGQLVRNEKGSVMSRKIAYNAMQRAINTIAQSIVEEIAGINFDAGGIM